MAPKDITPLNTGHKPPIPESQSTPWGSKMREFCGRAWKACVDLPKHLLSLVGRVSDFFKKLWDDYEEELVSTKNIITRNPLTNVRAEPILIKSTPQPTQPTQPTPNTVFDTAIKTATQIPSPPNPPYPTEKPPKSLSQTDPLPLINVPGDGSCYYYSLIAGIVRSENHNLYDQFTKILIAAQKSNPSQEVNWDFNQKSFLDWVNDRKKRFSFDQNLSNVAEEFTPVMRLLRCAMADFIQQAPTNTSLGEVEKDEITGCLDSAIEEEINSSVLTVRSFEEDRDLSTRALAIALKQAKLVYPELTQEASKKSWTDKIPKEDQLPASIAKKKESILSFIQQKFPERFEDWLGINSENLEKILKIVELENAKPVESDNSEQITKQRERFVQNMKTSGQWGNQLQSVVLRHLFQGELGLRIWGPDHTLKSLDTRPNAKVVIDIYHSGGHYQAVNSNSKTEELLKNIEQQQKSNQPKPEHDEFNKIYNLKIQHFINLKTKKYQRKINHLLQILPSPKVLPTPPASPSTAPASSTQKLTPAEELIQQIDATIRSISSHREAAAFLPSLKSMKTALSKNADTALEQYSAFTETLSTMAGIGIVTPRFLEIPALTLQKKQLPLEVIPTPSDGSCAIYALCLSALANQEAQKLLSKETSFNNLIKDKENLLKNGVTDLSSQSMQNLLAVSKGLREKLVQKLQIIVKKAESDRSAKEKVQIMSMQSAAQDTLLNNKERKKIIDTWRAKEDELSVLDASLTKENSNKNKEEDLLTKTNQEKTKKTKEKDELLIKINSLKNRREKSSQGNIKSVYQKAIETNEQALQGVEKFLGDVENSINTLQKSIDKTKNSIEAFEKRRTALLENLSYKTAKKDFDEMCLKNGYPDTEHLETGYVQTIANHSSYLDHVAIEELSSLLKIRIQVFQRKSKTSQVDPVVTYNPNQESWPVVSMFFEDRHYSAYIPPPPTSSP